MNQPSTLQPASAPPPPPMGSIDTATALLGSKPSPRQHLIATFRFQARRFDYPQSFGQRRDSRGDRQPMPKISTSM